MAGLKLSTFKNIFKPSLYTGAGLLKIVKDEKGNPIINPTREVLSKYLANVQEEGKDFEYVGKYELPFGYTDYASNGGIKRMSEEEYNALDHASKEEARGPEEVDMARISILVSGIIESKVDGKVVKEELYDLIQFKLLDAARFNNDGTKKQVFNTAGQTTWVGVDNAYIKGFRTKDVKVLPAFDKVGDFGIEEFIDFLYCYGGIARGENGDEILHLLNFAEIMEGNTDSVVSLINEIEAERTIKTGATRVEQYGVIALATPVNNKGTNNRNAQSFFPVFDRGIEEANGKVNDAFARIKGAISKARTPSKKTQIAYSPESKGIYVGANGNPTFGFKRLDEKVMEAFIAANNVNTSSRPAAFNNAGPANASGAAENPFGI